MRLVDDEIAAVDVKQQLAQLLLESRCTGVHHIALAVDNFENAMDDVSKRGVAFETGKPEKSLDGGKRSLLSLKATYFSSGETASDRIAPWGPSGTGSSLFCVRLQRWMVLFCPAKASTSPSG